MAVGQELVVHPFSPVVDGHSRVLILGDLPSVKSRENHFYYGHPQNRFWKVLAGVSGGGSGVGGGKGFCWQMGSLCGM